MYAGQLNPIKDANNLPSGTVYYCYGDTVHIPDKKTCNVLTLGLLNNLFQIAAENDSINPGIYFRAKHETGGWSSWRSL